MNLNVLAMILLLYDYQAVDKRRPAAVEGSSSREPEAVDMDEAKLVVKVWMEGRPDPMRCSH